MCFSQRLFQSADIFLRVLEITHNHKICRSHRLLMGQIMGVIFNPEIVNGWDTWKSLPKRVSEKGKTVYVFRKTQLIKVIKPKKLES